MKVPGSSHHHPHVASSTVSFSETPSPCVGFVDAPVHRLSVHSLAHSPIPTSSSQKPEVSEWSAAGGCAL